MDVTRATGAIGADVRGLDLSQPLDDKAVRLVREALAKHLVLFFRDQQVLSVEQHKALVRRFGEPEIAPFQRDASDPELLLLDQTDPRGSQAANFHADNTFRPAPPMGAILQAQVVPDAGGDTCFASMYAAWDALSPRMQAYLEGLEAWHSLEQMAARLASHGLKTSLKMDEWPPVRHPVVAVHPETGRKLLNVNYNWTTQIADLPAAESRAILAFLYEHIKSPEFQVRLRWHPGDIAFWDNRAVQHYAVPDWSGRRVMQRIAIAGETPPIPA
ncbi:MAG: TauD/TfdA family dioxygenase [Novosphingobium sp.]|nr:TauD/TfdA family dioxygenase [Novosphingobium sp.]